MPASYTQLFATLIERKPDGGGFMIKAFDSLPSGHDRDTIADGGTGEKSG